MTLPRTPDSTFNEDYAAPFTKQEKDLLDNGSKRRIDRPKFGNRDLGYTSDKPVMSGLNKSSDDRH